MTSPSDPSNVSRRVVVLGASDSPERFSNRALRRLVAAGFTVIPINPNLSEVAGIPCLPSLDQVDGPIDSVTVYLSPSRSTPLAEEILALRPRRVVFNPGAENRDLERQLEENGIESVEACTLIMLEEGAF